MFCFSARNMGGKRSDLLDLRRNEVEEPKLNELLEKSSGGVVFNYIFCFLRETRILGNI